MILSATFIPYCSCVGKNLPAPTLTPITNCKSPNNIIITFGMYGRDFIKNSNRELIYSSLCCDRSPENFVSQHT